MSAAKKTIYRCLKIREEIQGNKENVNASKWKLSPRKTMKPLLPTIAKKIIELVFAPKPKLDATNINTGKQTNILLQFQFNFNITNNSGKGK